MLKSLFRSLEVGLLVLVGYNLIVAVFGWKNRPRVDRAGSPRNFRVVVPAHNEEAVIDALLGDLAALTGPSEAEVVVLADHCTDETVAVASARDVTVVERESGAGGKGAALAWYLESAPLLDGEVFVVLDADNRVPPDLIERFSQELDQGHHVLQAYLGISNPDASAVATASALSYWASNRMVQLARRNLGWTADLGGTGMCLTKEALDVVGGFGSSLVEDQELGVRLFLAGHPVTWLHDVSILDEKPTSAAVSVRQRSRWASGRTQVARKYVPELLARRDMASFDLAVRLFQPSRMLVAVFSAGLAVASALGAPTLGTRLWVSVAGVQVFAPLPFLWREGVERRYLIRYPMLTLLPLLKIPARLIRQRGWYHTPHSG